MQKKKRNKKKAKKKTCCTFKGLLLKYKCSMLLCIHLCADNI